MINLIYRIYLTKEVIFRMSNIMYSDNDIDSLDYRSFHHVRRITINDLDILGNGLKEYIKRYKTLFAYNDEEEKIFEELDKISDLLIQRKYDQLIFDPSYMIDPNNNKEDYL